MSFCTEWGEGHEEKERTRRRETEEKKDDKTEKWGKRGSAEARGGCS